MKNKFIALWSFLVFNGTAKSQITIQKQPAVNTKTIAQTIIKPSAHALLIDPNGNDFSLGTAVRTDFLTGIASTFKWTNSNTDDAFLLVDAAAMRSAGFMISDKDGKNMEGKIVFRAGTRIQAPGQATQTAVTSAWQMLGIFDQNKDGKIDNADPVWQSISLFSDKNADGIINPGELITLNGTTIRSISLTGHLPEKTDPSGNKRVDGTFTWANGSSGLISDINFSETGATGMSPSGNVINQAIMKTPVHALMIDQNGNDLSLGTAIRTELLTGMPATFKWTNTNTDDAFLLLDATSIRTAGFQIRDKNGNSITSKILFRNGISIQVPGQATATTITTSWQMLALFDQNKDGKIDSMDPVWQSLSLFLDNNADGLLNPGEINVISGTSLRSISLTGHLPERTDPSGNRRVDGTFTRTNGTAGKVSDISFN